MTGGAAFTDSSGMYPDGGWGFDIVLKDVKIESRGWRMENGGRYE
jgi:hypothetical protein